MSKEAEIFQGFLRKNGLKFTPERVIILRLVFETHEHFDAEELFMAVRRAGERVSKATIYRTLDILVESGLVRRHTFDDRQARYEHIFGHKYHEHLHCLSCHRIFEFTHEDLDRIQASVCERYKFTPASRSFFISGYCSRCSPPPLPHPET
ncbi:MAG: transcriptional repressor [Planctomycetes bacterium]|nr:transcriptional repressor [Planctomycetota bacterium]